MAEKARIGIIGTGWWATQAHLPALKKNADADLVAIADLRPDVLAKAAAAYEVDKTYTDYIEMIDQEKLDGVIIPVHHVAHYEIARTCLERDLHIMLEKPMVLQATHARELTELAHERQRQLIVGYPWHYTPHTLRAREVLHSGDLGQIRFINSVFASMVIKFYRGDDSSYGSVFDYPVVGPGDVYSDPVRSGGGQGHLQVTHSAALMFFITGLKPLQVSALMDNMDVKVDVIDAMAMRMDNGALATVGSTGTIASGGTDQLQTRVFCDKGWIDLDSLQGTLRICHADGSIEEVTPLQSEQIYPMHMTSVNLVQVIRGEAENGSPPEVGWRTVEMLDAAYRSVQQGGQLVEVASLY